MRGQAAEAPLPSDSHRQGGQGGTETHAQRPMVLPPRGASDGHWRLVGRGGTPPTPTAGGEHPSITAGAAAGATAAAVARRTQP